MGKLVQNIIQNFCLENVQLRQQISNQSYFRINKHNNLNTLYY